MILNKCITATTLKTVTAAQEKDIMVPFVADDPVGHVLVWGSKRIFIRIYLIEFFFLKVPIGFMFRLRR